jgi:hypothetical protein
MRGFGGCWLGHLRGRSPPVDEQSEQFDAEEEQPVESSVESAEPTLSQRELVRASLLRCPPPDAAGPSRP